MSDGYTELEFTVDEQDLAQTGFDVMAAGNPGWEPHPEAMATWLIETAAAITSAGVEVANLIPDRIFHRWIEQHAGIPPMAGTPAALTTTWTFRDAAGYTVPAGTLLSVVNPAGDPIEFQTTQDITCPAGDTVVANQVISTVDATGDVNGLTPAPGDVQIAEPMDYVTSVEPVGVTSGGSDPETEQAYLDRGTRRLRLSGGALVLGPDYVAAAEEVIGVERAVALNGFIPPNLTNQERAVTVAVHGPGGVACSTAVKNQVDAVLQARREVNFVINVIDPDFNPIDVTVTAVAYEGYDPATVQALVDAALREFLSPGLWPRVPVELGQSWMNRTTIRYFDVVAAVDQVIGVDYITSLQVNGGTSDVNLTGVAPLPTPDAINVTVTAP